MRLGNCWLYAFPRWWRKGGYLVVCWSPRNRYIPHAMWTDSLQGVTVHEFIPDRPRTGLVGLLFAIVFRGRVRVRRMPGPDDTLTGARRD